MSIHSADNRKPAGSWKDIWAYFSIHIFTPSYEANSA